MIGIRLGVDYGTCTTAAVLEWPDRRRQPLPPRPSAVCARPDGRLLVGTEAVRAAGSDPTGFEPYPRRRLDEPEIPLGPRGWRPAELIAATLAEVAADAYRASGGAPVGQLVMVHPIGWGTARREVLVAAATAAGLPAPVLVTEPVAAAGAFAAGRPDGLPPGRAVVVYHLGGGTFEACVLRGGVDGQQPLAHQNLPGAGGLDLDAALLAHLTGASGTDDRPAVQRYHDDLRTGRETLSREPTATVHLPVAGRDVRVTREELDRVVEPVLRRTVEATRTAIDEAHVQPADVDALLLTGGASRTPLVADLLQQATGITPVAFDDPESIAAHGALDAVPAAAGFGPATPGVPERRRRWLVPVIAGAGALVVLAAVAVVGGVWLLGRNGVPDAVALPDGGAALLKAASTGIVAATSYDYRDLARNERAADAVMTDRMRKTYGSTMSAIRDTVRQQQAVVSSQVSTAGLASATADRATVMLYLDQYRTNTTLTSPKVDQSVVQAGLVRQRGRWLLDRTEARTTALAGAGDATWPGAKLTAMLTDARSCLTSFLSADYHRPDASFAAVERCATGTFGQGFRQDEEQVRQGVASGHVTSRVGGLGAAVVSASASRATVLVAADTSVRNDRTPTARTSHYRCQLTVTRSGDRWLVSELRFVP